MTVARPSITSPCVADRGHLRGERIAEITWPDGRGCLVSISTSPDGKAEITIYRADLGLVVRVPHGAETSTVPV